MLFWQTQVADTSAFACRSLARTRPGLEGITSAHQATVQEQLPVHPAENTPYGPEPAGPVPPVAACLATPDPPAAAAAVEPVVDLAELADLCVAGSRGHSMPRIDEAAEIVEASAASANAFEDMYNEEEKSLMNELVGCMPEEADEGEEAIGGGSRMVLPRPRSASRTVHPLPAAEIVPPPRTCMPRGTMVPSDEAERASPPADTRLGLASGGDDDSVAFGGTGSTISGSSPRSSNRLLDLVPSGLINRRRGGGRIHIEVQNEDPKHK